MLLNRVCMKVRSRLFFLLFFGFSIMTILNGILYTKNLSYKKENKGLIIQNDSILSANIELQQELKRTQALSEHKASTKRKVAYKK